MLLIYPLPGSVGDTSSKPVEVASSGSKMHFFFFLSVVFWILDHFNPRTLTHTILVM